MRADQYAQPSVGAGLRTCWTRSTLGRLFDAGRDTAAPAVATRRGSGGATTTGAEAGPVAAARARGPRGAPGRGCTAAALTATARRTKTGAGATRWPGGGPKNQAPAPGAGANPAVRTAICP